MTPRRRGLRIALALVTAAALGACGGARANSEADDHTYVFWDPYPQFDAKSDWVRLVKGCGKSAGVDVKRTGFDGTELTTKALLAAQQGTSPDVMVMDNPVVSTFVEAETLKTTRSLGLDISPYERNIIAAGQVDGRTYGIPIGANTLALYYNKKVLRGAGVAPRDITDWASLTRALQKVKASGKKGITFSALGTEEGTFQFLPWFWGNGAKLRALDSPRAEAALKLWKGWLDAGYAPNSVLNNNQTSTWQEFATGDYAFGLNGTWQLANAEESGIDYGVIPVPGARGGAAAAATGGEFVTAPIQSDGSRYATTKKIMSCLVSERNLLATDTALSYVAPVRAVQERQVRENPALAPWVEAVRTARGRTSGGLGTDYPLISEQLWTAFQNALSGAQSPQDALGTAQRVAREDTAD
ncbi:sugar ABC transporter substrate-binding protein [Streptomyces boncukensis]|uniref:Extracellular solute-binding protein n=1 Tax=Streptomyces boncukensis TaxID=2711219 RepID=A0A6G4X4R6_9ACTN|nr:extracellular solute-binding protein [Streptomyces boncukensis]NGO72122.1 extracellular solute-binding protein [Streptomyces boncukensis]